MVRRPTGCSVLIFIGYLFFVLALVSLYQYLNVQDNKCLMTFMYETPNFIPVPMPKKLETNFNKYKIYAYKEGKKDDKFSYSDFNGVPVLFIPGSSGSFRQVRSFASVSMNFFRHYQTRSHLDFFAIDYNEELSGVYGPYLQNQTVFLNQAIKVIKRLYYRKSDDVKLLVIAHSVGGVIFKGLLSLSSFKLDDIFLFLSLATPHRNSVFAFDSSFHAYYSQIANRLRNDRAIFEAYQRLAKISIGGGLNDNLVRSDLTSVDGQTNQWSLTSNSMPEVWVAADHKCIVWCKQLVKKLVHLIFDLLEERWTDVRMLARNQIIEHHLNYRFNDRMAPRYRTRSPLPEGKSKYHVIDKRLFVLDRPRVMDQLIYRFDLVRNTYFSIVSTSLHRSDWIFACDAEDRCLSAQSYSNSPVPSVNEFNGVKRNHFLLDSNTYLDQNYTRMALKIAPSVVRTGFQFERIINGRRDRELELPGVLSRLLFFFSPFHTLLQVSVGEESTFYNLTLANFDQIWQNYHLRMEVGRCYPHAKEDAVLIMNVPWYREDRFWTFESKKETIFNAPLSLNVPKYDQNDARKIRLWLVLDPYCEYKLKIKFSLRESLIQLFRHYAFLFLPITTSLLLSAYSVQVRATLQSPFALSNELVQRTEHHSTLRHILIAHLNEITYFGLQPAVPYLIHVALSALLQRFGHPDFLESNLLSIKYTRHNSHINALFVSYLIYTFIYFLLFIVVHLLSHLLSFIIALNQLIFLNGAYLQFKPAQLSKDLWKGSPLTNPRTLSRLSLIVALAAAIYLRLIVYALVAVYLFELLMLATRCTLEQRKVGLTKATTRCYLDLSRFILIALAFVPLVPKFIVWFITNELVLDKTIILYKICFGISLVQLHFQIQNDVSERRIVELSYLTKVLALVCLCAAPLDYTVITISCLLVLILRSAHEFTSLLERWRSKPPSKAGGDSVKQNGELNKSPLGISKAD